MADADQPEPIAQKRERSPSFPYLDLDMALDHARKLHRVAKMNEVRLFDVSTAWNMAVNSGSFMRYIAAVGQFGLIDSNGSSAQRKLRVSATARRIFEDDRPGIREALLSEAALTPKLIRGLFLGEEGMPRWGRDRPSDAIAESALKFDLEFSAEAARRFLAVYDATIKYVLVSDDAIKGVDTAKAEALESGSTGTVESTMQPEKMHVATQATPPAGELNKISFRSDGPGRITISATLDAEGLDLLEKKLEAFKLLLN